MTTPTATGWTLTIPGWHPPRANEYLGRHWRVKHRLRKAATELLAVYARLQNVPPAAGRRRVRLLLTGWGRGGRFPDADAYDKLLLDALVGAGLLVDDDARGIEGRVGVEFRRGVGRQTGITLEDVGLPGAGEATTVAAPAGRRGTEHTDAAGRGRREDRAGEVKEW